LACRFWPLWCLPFFGLRLLAIVMFAFVWFTAFGHCDACQQRKANITMAKRKRTNNDLRDTAQKAKYQATRTLL
jgi:hypothetical protein